MCRHGAVHAKIAGFHNPKDCQFVRGVIHLCLHGVAGEKRGGRQENRRRQPAAEIGFFAIYRVFFAYIK